MEDRKLVPQKGGRNRGRTSWMGLREQMQCRSETSGTMASAMLPTVGLAYVRTGRSCQEQSNGRREESSVVWEVSDQGRR